MIEKILFDYLTTKLSPISVKMDIPSNPPKQMVTIEKTGGSEDNFIKSATVAIQSYDESRYKAMLLNESVKDAMRDAIELDDIVSVNLNSDYNFTDTNTKKYRYQAVFNVIHY